MIAKLSLFLIALSGAAAQRSGSMSRSNMSVTRRPTSNPTTRRPTSNPTRSPSRSPIVLPEMALENIRFNKVPPIVSEGSRTIFDENAMYTEGVHSEIYPLMPEDYPLSEDHAKVLRFETTADSVVINDLDYQLYDAQGPEYWLDDERLHLSYPGTDEFWDEMRQVVEAQLARQRGDDALRYNRWPDIWEGYTLDDVATAVQGEYPALHQQTVLEKIYQGGLEMYQDMGYFRSVNDFIGKQVRLAAINTWTFEAVAPVNFMLKWHVGMPRPEEVAWMIYNDGFEGDAVPQDLVEMIKEMNMNSAPDFTAYDSGSPKHPSFPAMHSAGSTISFWLPAVAKISAEQYCEALRVDYAVAFGRTVAGVHYPMDNLAGLNIGQRIIKELLPEMLEERYGYDSEYVRTKLEALSFDWNTFDSEDCTIDGVSASDFLDAANVAGVVGDNIFA